MARPNDTSPEAERVLIDIYRKMSVSQKWRRLGQIYRTAKILHATGVRSRKPGASAQEIRDDWVAVTLGESVLQTLKESGRGGGR